MVLASLGELVIEPCARSCSADDRFKRIQIERFSGFGGRADEIIVLVGCSLLTSLGGLEPLTQARALTDDLVELAASAFRPAQIAEFFRRHASRARGSIKFSLRVAHVDFKSSPITLGLFHYWDLLDDRRDLCSAADQPCIRVSASSCAAKRSRSLRRWSRRVLSPCSVA
jgi:hypothetical protein